MAGAEEIERTPVFAEMLDQETGAEARGLVELARPPFDPVGEDGAFGRESAALLFGREGLHLRQPRAIEDFGQEPDTAAAALTKLGAERLHNVEVLAAAERVGEGRKDQHTVTHHRIERVEHSFHLRLARVSLHAQRALEPGVDEQHVGRSHPERAYRLGDLRGPRQNRISNIRGWQLPW